MTFVGRGLRGFDAAAHRREGPRFVLGGAHARDLARALAGKCTLVSMPC